MKVPVLSRGRLQLLFYSGLYGGSALLVKVIGFAIFMWLAHKLTVEEFATFGLLYTLQQAVATFGLIGIVEAVIGLLKDRPDPAGRRQLFSSAYSAFGAIALAVSVFVVVLFWVLGRTSALSFVHVVALLSGLLLALASLESNIVKLSERHVSAMLFGSLPALGGFVGGFVGVVIKGTAPSFFVGSCVGIAGAMALLWIGRVPNLGEGAQRPDLIRILKRAAPFFSIACFGLLSGYGNNYLIELFFVSAEVARFTFALSLCSTLVLIAGALNQVWAPRFYRLIGEEDFATVERKNGAFYRVLALVLGVAGGGLVLLIGPVLTKLGGNLVEYRSMQLELSLLCAAQILATAWWHCYNHFLPNAMGKVVFRVVTGSGIAGVAASLALMWYMGAIGIYLGICAQTLVRVVAIVISARRRWPVQVVWSGVCIGLLFVAAGFGLATAPVSFAVAVAVYVLAAAGAAALVLRYDVARLAHA